MGHGSTAAGHGTQAMGYCAHAGIFGGDPDLHRGNTAMGNFVYASGSSSTVFGAYNCVTGGCSTIAGGYLNTASGTCSFIGGGKNNTVNGTSEGVIVGGCQNNMSSAASAGFIGGGNTNTNNSEYGVLVGGDTNCLHENTLVSFIGGGACNCIGNGDYSVIVGGSLNTGSGGCSFIGGGSSNTAKGVGSSIAGGCNNLASGSFSFASGELSKAEGAQSFAFGYAVTASAGASVAIGGAVNTVCCTALNSVALGGVSNDVESCNSIVSGLGNCVCNSVSGGAKSSITSGEQNEVIAPFGLVVGTQNHVLGGSATGVRGGNIVGGCGNCVNGGNSAGNLVMGNLNNVGNASTSVGGAAAFGGGNDVFANGTVAIGENNCTISGQPTYGHQSLLVGCQNQNHFGQASIVGGFASDGYGSNSIAFGLGATSANGCQQYAFGCGTTNPNNGSFANIDNSFVIGKYNVWSITDCHLFAVGNGTSNILRSNAFNVSSNGRVGVCCTSPQSALDVNGTTRTTALVETSARRYKENIVSLQDQLDNLKKLEPVEFEWKETKKKDIGLIAEDVEKIYPHLVEHDDNGDLMGVKYSKLTSVLIKALQEQQEQIDELKKEIFILKQQE